VRRTRYLRDAEARYLAEQDAGSWAERLRIIGADFRAAGDVFHLVGVVKECCANFDGSGEGGASSSSTGEVT
jgi:hypothetical protein